MQVHQRVWFFGNISHHELITAAILHHVKQHPSKYAGKPWHNIVQILKERGLLQEVSSPDLEKLAAHTTFPVYCGFDPTADSLHLGNLLGIIVLRWFAICGHTPVALLGGATGRVGDPSGQSPMHIMTMAAQ